jgi:hypothetical protein
MTYQTSCTLPESLLEQIAVRGPNPGTLYYACGDHLGSIAIWTTSDSGVAGSSTARYQTYGCYRVKPVAAVNPAISDRGDTGHRRCVHRPRQFRVAIPRPSLHECLLLSAGVGRFVSPDTIVPELSIPP